MSLTNDEQEELPLTVDPYGYWETGILVSRRSNNIQVQTIFRLLVTDLIWSVTNTFLTCCEL